MSRKPRQGERAHVCSDDCRYRALYEGSQRSLLDMASRQAGAVSRVGRLRNQLILAAKRAFPRPFTEAEKSLNTRMSEVSDEVLVAYLESFLNHSVLGGKSSADSGLDELRTALESIGVPVPDSVDFAEWAEAVNRYGRNPDVDELFRNGPMVTDSIKPVMNRDLAVPAEPVSTEPSPSLDDLFGPGPDDPKLARPAATAPTQTQPAAVTQPVAEPEPEPATEPDPVAKNDAANTPADTQPVDDQLVDEQPASDGQALDDLFNTAPKKTSKASPPDDIFALTEAELETSDPFGDLDDVFAPNEAFDDAPFDDAEPFDEPEPDAPFDPDESTDSGTGAAEVDDAAASEAPGGEQAPGDEPEPVGDGSDDAGDDIDDAAQPESAPAVPEATAIPVPQPAPWNATPPDTDKADAEKASDKKADTKKASVKKADTDKTDAAKADAGTGDGSKPTPAAGTAKKQWKPQDAVKPQIFPAPTKKKKPKNRGHRSRVSRALPASTLPDGVVTDGPAPTELTDDVRDQLRSIAALPRPVFTSDLAHHIGSVDVVQSWETEGFNGTETDFRFLKGKDRDRHRGALVVPGDTADTTNDYKTSLWASCVDTFRGSRLYQLGVFFHRFGDNTVSYDINPELVVARLSLTDGLIGAVLVTGPQLRDGGSTRDALLDTVEKLLGETLVRVAILTTNAEWIEDITDAITVGSVERDWPVATPVMLSRSWEFADGTGETIPLLGA